MILYPVCLKLDKMLCCVIGGGAVALRKVQTLLKSSDNITIISPKLCFQLKQLHKKNAFNYQKTEYKKNFIKDAFLIIAATNDQAVNAQIVKDANKMGKLINVVDVPEQCNFYLPSVVNKKGILLSISTQGAFPGLAKKIRQDTAVMIKKYADNIGVLSRLRDEIKLKHKDKRTKKRLIDALLDDKILELINNKKIRKLVELKAHLKIS
ncbi:MAG: bifunctional precorrin-2 dehydrogenase/sirohydrochlorin ferrochelatase [Candidatus Omnitrophica bacterium]|nr:bifunctional precorrin-2 dehydrogenase/sirohydrochlorin ferrochelatase [Candidatus Omnitrophota bacterium]